MLALGEHMTEEAEASQDEPEEKQESARIQRDFNPC